MISFCVPSKNNLRYLKLAVESIKKNSHYKNNEIFVYVDKDEDGTCEWLECNDIRYTKNYDEDCKGIGYAYDTLFRHAKYDLVVAFHADMVLGKNADLNLIKHHKLNKVVCSTRIEPPLHPPGPEKIVKDFGIWPEDFKWKDFDDFVEKTSLQNKGKTSKSTFAPWLIDRRNHLGHDPIFLSVYEDADLFRRFVLAGYDMVQSWDSLVYHLTCRGGQFLGAEKVEDFQKKDEQWLMNNQLSMLEYIRKWGGMFKEYGPCEPRPNKKYNVGLKAINCQTGWLGYEPYFDNLCVDINHVDYVKEMQPKSKFNLYTKFVKELHNDIVLEVNFSDSLQASQFPNVISNLEDILEQAEPNQAYDIDGIKLIVKTKIPKSIKLQLP